MFDFSKGRNEILGGEGSIFEQKHAQKTDDHFVELATKKKTDADKVIKALVKAGGVPQTAIHTAKVDKEFIVQVHCSTDLKAKNVEKIAREANCSVKRIEKLW